MFLHVGFWKVLWSYFIVIKWFNLQTMFFLINKSLFFYYGQYKHHLISWTYLSPSCTGSIYRNSVVQVQFMIVYFYLVNFWPNFWTRLYVYVCSLYCIENTMEFSCMNMLEILLWGQGGLFWSLWLLFWLQFLTSYFGFLFTVLWYTVVCLSVCL